METTASDSELLLAARTGSPEAIGKLWERHHEAGMRVARAQGGGHDPEDLVSDAFTNVLSALRNGAGPTESFRAYFYTCIRNAARHDRGESDLSDDLMDRLEDDGPSTDDRLEEKLNNHLLTRAFRALPEKWQAALWYVDVERMSGQESGMLLGMSNTAVSSLTHRARRGLRGAWIQEHVLTEAVPQECRDVLSHVGEVEAGTASPRTRAKVDAHVPTCALCHRVTEDALETSRRLGFVLLPAVIGAAALPLWKADLGIVAQAAGPAPGHPGATSNAGSQPASQGHAAHHAGVKAGASGSGHGILPGPAAAWIAGAGVAGAAAVVAIAMSLSGASTPAPPVAAPSSALESPSLPASSFSPQVTPTPAGSDTPTPSTSPSPSDGASASPSASPSPSSTPAPSAAALAWGAPVPAKPSYSSRKSFITITGTAEPGSVVSGAGATAPTAADGTFSLTVYGLSDGKQALSLRAGGGDRPTSPAASVAVSVDTSGPATPTVNAQGGTPLMAPAYLAGRGEAGSKITVRNSAGTVVGTTTVSGSGSWVAAIPGADLTSSKLLSVTATDDVGNSSGTATATVPTPWFASSKQGNTDDGTPTWTLKLYGAAGAQVRISVNGEAKDICGASGTSSCVVGSDGTLMVKLKGNADAVASYHVRAQYTNASGAVAAQGTSITARG